MDLTPYVSIQSNLFVDITIYDDAGISEVVRLSDYHRSLTIGADSYTGLGTLMAITDSSSDIRATPYEVTITVSGISLSDVAKFGSSNIKGSRVRVRRALFDPATGVLLPISGNPAGRFTGIVNNYALSEEYSSEDKNSTATIALICSSNVNVLESKISGRATNPEDQKALNANDISMDRVPNIANSNFNFGAPR